LGKAICEKQKESNWGDSLIEQVAKDLSAAFPGMKGFSRRNLFYIRKWYVFYMERGIVQQVVALIGDGPKNDIFQKISQLVKQIPWGHNMAIIVKCSNVETALFYVRQTIQNNWSRAMLLAQIESRLFERQGRAIQNFQLVLPIPQADLARETLKNPYNFDFLSLGKEAGEKDLEIALIDHIQKFLLELGQGFAYVVMVEYALENVSSPLGVSEYQISSAVPEDLKGSLPSIEALEQELEDSI
jgi:predicted nuclease of restriction endonuclease-like (RecB) superfamily